MVPNFGIKKHHYLKHANPGTLVYNSQYENLSTIFNQNFEMEAHDRLKEAKFELCTIFWGKRSGLKLISIITVFLVFHCVISVLTKGRHSLKKVANFWALPKLAKNPPPTPQFGQLGPLFSGRQNDVLRVWQGKSTNDDNDNCNDNFDSNYGNFDDYDEKMTKKH